MASLAINLPWQFGCFSPAIKPWSWWKGDSLAWWHVDNFFPELTHDSAGQTPWNLIIKFSPKSIESQKKPHWIAANLSKPHEIPLNPPKSTMVSNASRRKAFVYCESSAWLEPRGCCACWSCRRPAMRGVMLYGISLEVSRNGASDSIFERLVWFHLTPR